MAKNPPGKRFPSAASTVVSERDGVLVSVIVPTHQRPAQLARLLDSLSQQTLGVGRFEVIVVEDGNAGPRPDTAAWAPNVRLFRQQQQGPAAARNAGARHAHADLLAFIDDDCVAAPGWLCALIAAHRQSPDALLGGLTINGVPDNLLSDVAESLRDFVEADTHAADGSADRSADGHADRRAERASDRGADQSADRGSAFAASNNMAFGRRGFEAIGGFDTSYPLAAGEDRALCRRWCEELGGIVRVPAASVFHHHSHTLASFWRQQCNYGQGAARFFDTDRSDDVLDTAGSGRAPRLRRPPRELSFYVRLLLHPLFRRDWPLSRRLRALPLVLLSQVAIVTGFRRYRATVRHTVT